MLENINLKKKLSREEYKQQIPGLQSRLYDLEKACWDNGVPTMIVFEGWDASGKGTAIAALTQRLDPRGFKLYPITAPANLRAAASLAVAVLVEGAEPRRDGDFRSELVRPRARGAREATVPEKVWRQAYRDIVEFERMLADDGTVILKFFLHISKKEQQKRFEAIEADPLEAWRVTKQDWARHKKYDEYLAATEEMLELTESEYRAVDDRGGDLPMVRAQKGIRDRHRGHGEATGRQSAARERTRRRIERCRSARGHGVFGRRRRSDARDARPDPVAGSRSLRAAR